MTIKFYSSFDFSRTAVLAFPTASLHSHRTISREAWQREPWYGKVAIFGVYRLYPHPPTSGYRLWIYTRWGSCHFDIYFDRRAA